MSSQKKLDDNFIEEVNKNFVRNSQIEKELKENSLDSDFIEKKTLENNNESGTSFKAQKAFFKALPTFNPVVHPLEQPSNFNKNNQEKRKTVNMSAFTSKLTTLLPELQSFSENLSQNSLNEIIGASAPIVAETEKSKPPVGVYGWKEVAAHNQNSSIKIAPIKPTHHNTSIFIYLTMGLAWLGLSLGAGFSWCLLIIGFCCVYYQKILERYDCAAKDDVLRDLWVKKLENESETVAWFNNFLERFWVIYEPGLSASIKDSIDSILEISTPPFLESISLSVFQLGNKAPFIYKVKTVPCCEADTILMDLALEFMPSNNENMSKRQINNQINPKMTLQIRVGKGMVGAGMPVLMENFSIKGNLRVRITFGIEYPHVEFLGFQFLERPTIDFILKPVGGESFGFDISYIPGLYSFIKDQIHELLSPTMYFPNELLINLNEFWYPDLACQITGVLRVNFRSVRDLKQKDGGGDLYIQATGDSKFQHIKTSTKSNTLRPDWNEVHTIIVYKSTENLTLKAFGSNAHRKNFEYGSALLDLVGFSKRPTQIGLKLNLKRDDFSSGNLLLDCQLFSTISKFNNHNFSNHLFYKSGVLRLILHQIKDLDSRKAKISSDCKKKRNNSPYFEEVIDCVINDIDEAIILLTIKDDNGLVNDSIIAQWSQTASFLIKNKGWFPLNNVDTGKIKLTSTFYPLDIEENQSLLNQISSYHLGVVQIHIMEALQLKLSNLRSDIHINVSLSGSFSARTNKQSSSFVPRWGQSFFIPVCSLSDNILLELYESYNGESSSVGYVELQTSELIENVEEDYFSKGLANNWSPLSLNNGRTQGLLHFGACFYSTKDFKEHVTFNDDTLYAAYEDPTSNFDLNLPDSFILSLTIHGARGLEPGNLSASAFLIGKSSLFVVETDIHRNTGSPTWEKTGTIFVRDAVKEILSVTVQDQRSVNVGKWEISASKLLSIQEKNKTWVSLGENFELLISYTYQFVEYEKIVDIEQLLGSGHLTVHLIKAHNLVDSGTCDSFIKVKVNQTKVFKSCIIKKTANPVFNQDFTIPLLDYNSSSLLIEVFDSNKINLNERLGYVTIPLKDVGLEYPIENEYFLDGSNYGQIKICLVYISSFLNDNELTSACGRITAASSSSRNTINLGVSSFLSGKMDGSQVPTANTSLFFSNIRKKRQLARSSVNPATQDATGRPGKLNVTILSAIKLVGAEKNGYINSYVKARCSGKVIHTTKIINKMFEPSWNEPFSLTLYDGGPCWIHFTVMNHNRFNSDKNIGEISLNVWEHVNPDSLASHRAQFWTPELRGGEPGRLQLEMEYIPL